MGKRKDHGGGPRKLEKFKNHSSVPVRKNFPGSPQHSDAGQQSAHLREGEIRNTEKGTHFNDSDMVEEMNGPQRQRRRISPLEDYASGSILEHNKLSLNNPYADKLLAFPTLGQPILDTDIKEMLLSLRGAIQQDVQS